MPPIALLYLFIGVLVIVIIALLWIVIVSPSLPRPPPSGPGYIILTGVSSPPYCTHARQYLHLLFQKGVPAFCVRVLRPEGESPSEAPSSNIGLPPLEVPAEYRNCITSFVDDILGDLHHAIRHFAYEPSITRIVLVYIGDGTEKSLAFPSAKININDMAECCLDARKPFLAVLDASYSTVFAEKTIRELRRLGYGGAIDVSFLTSGRGLCFNSAVLLSSETPELLPWYGGASYKINSSMFSRAFLLGLAHKYQFDITLSELPGALNVPGAAMKNGFEAAIQYGTWHNDTVPLRDFFPWGPVGKHEKSRVRPAVPFTAVIPNVELGGFCDDVGNFCNDRSEFAFCDIVACNGAVRVNQTGVLSDSDPRQRAVLQQLKELRLSRSPAAERPRKKAKPVPVPFDFIAAVVRAQFQEHAWRLLTRWDVSEWIDELDDFVVKLNGKVTPGFGHEIRCICELTATMDRGQVKDMIVEARKQVAKLLRIDLEPTLNFA
jgi:hypothetical protein